MFRPTYSEYDGKGLSSSLHTVGCAMKA